MVAGIEISTAEGEAPIHILGYSFSLTNQAILDFCELQQKRRDERNRSILKLLQGGNFVVREEDLPSEGSVGRPHIAQVLVAKGYARDIKHAFRRFVGDRCRYYVSGEKATVAEAIDVIHEAGGYAVVAHPHLIRDQRALEATLDEDFDGIEVFYARFPADKEKRWYDVATEKKWIMTGGSDFHGANKPETDLGRSWVCEETFRMLEQRHRENNP